MMSVSHLVTRALDGDQRAWDDLIARYLSMVHAICRGYRLGAEDAADVNQVVWLRLVEHLSRIPLTRCVWAVGSPRPPHECLRVLRASGRVVLTGDEASLDASDLRDRGVDSGLLVYERDRALMRAFGQLGERCQQLLRLLMADPPPSYDEIAAALDMPVGSIGPTRGRCLEQLRHLLG